MSGADVIVPRDYGPWLADLKRRIEGARARAALAANAEQIALYHEIGRELLARRKRDGWGAKVVDRLAADLHEAFPDLRGFSARNLKYLRQFAEAAPEARFGQQAAAQLPWFHVVTLITRLDQPATRGWYVGKLNYLGAVDAQVRGSDDRPTIGILLCRRKNRIVAEYALSGIDKPIGVAEYHRARASGSPGAQLPEHRGARGGAFARTGERRRCGGAGRRWGVSTDGQLQASERTCRPVRAPVRTP